MKARQTWIQKENPNQHRIEDEIGCGWLTFCLMITDLFQNKKKIKEFFQHQIYRIFSVVKDI